MLRRDKFFRHAEFAFALQNKRSKSLILLLKLFSLI